jgi:phage terminase large subunit-like protein
LYEQGRVHHVRVFETLETQMCRYVPGETSPDRMDALVWAMHKLFPVDDAPKGGFVMRYA